MIARGPVGDPCGAVGDGLRPLAQPGGVGEFEAGHRRARGVGEFLRERFGIDAPRRDRLRMPAVVVGVRQPSADERGERADLLRAIPDVAEDPEVARDHTSVNSYAVINPPMPEECNGAYQTQLNVGPGAFAFDFRLCWRHSVAEGLEDAPTLTATRWQKVWGSSNITLMEGSLVTRPLDGHPEITVVEYQYHLDALAANHGTVQSYLDVIYHRLSDRVHGRMLP